ncbi:MAG: hypothetical protein ACTTH7_02765 [Treponema sp.]
MKYVSRMVFGLSIAAVLALFTACPQAADTKKNSPNLNPLGIKQTDVADTISKMDSIKDNFDIEKGNITIKKAAASSITLPEKFGDNRTLKDVKITSGKSVTVEKSGKDFTLKVTKPTNGKAETVTLELKIEGKDKSGKTATSTISVTITNKKDIEEGSQSPAIGAVSFVVPKEDNKVTIKVAAITNGTAGTDYDKLVISAVKKGTQNAVEVEPAEIALADDPAVAALATGKELTLKGANAEAGAEYTFTLQLKKGNKAVGAETTAHSTSGKAAGGNPAAPAIGAVSFVVPKEDNKVTIKVAAITNGTAGTDYDKLVISAVKKGTQNAVEVEPAEIALADDPAVAALATGKELTLKGANAEAGAEYTFTLQLKKGNKAVGAETTAHSTSGKNS